MMITRYIGGNMTGKTRNINIFSCVVLGSSMVLWGSLILFKFDAPNLENQESTTILPMTMYILNGFIPSLAGIFFYIKQGRTDRLKSLLPNKGNLRAAIFLVWMFITVFVVQTLLYQWILRAYDYSIIGAQLVQLLPLVILGPLSEEIGWRGYLQDQFSPAHPVRTSLTIGIIWSLWHLPLFYISGTTQQTNQMSFISFTILIMLVSYIMTHFYNKSNGSLFLSVLIHYLYTVILTFYILGTHYSLMSDIISIIPVAIVTLILYYSGNKPSYTR